MTMTSEIADLEQVVMSTLELLRRHQHVLVTAESCTGGLIAASLAGVPTMSGFLAGGFVVYQTSSKVAWLGVPAALIEQFGVVSREVACQMADCALRKSANATVALSITGHLGPDAPTDLDGIAWVGIAFRDRMTKSQKLILPTEVTSATRPANPDVTTPKTTLRRIRQQDAVRQSLSLLCRELGDSE